MTCHVAYEPLGVPKPIAPDVWIVDGPEIRLRYLGLSVPFPTRATIIRLPSGELWVHSPVALDCELAARVGRLGRVRFLIAPNTLHASWIADWSRCWPAARSYGPPAPLFRGGSGCGFAEALGARPPSAWGDVFDQSVVSGDLLTEVVFFHRPSGTLVLTDLIENFEPCRVCLPWRWVMQVFGCADPDGKAPFDMQLSFVRSWPQLRDSVEAMLSWAPQRVLLAHGRPYLENGAAELRRAFRWVLPNPHG